eukprot:TRINITY_DN1480_c0_g1_i14.p2 TRINITY_DN1480_c0_g1~~TRINITY_DN1480_c0_g1_i14.p2  ORF type:complete len:203 (-),score=-0.27 TRINITY_DN1480_c0_g1_i14:66-674(-)
MSKSVVKFSFLYIYSRQQFFNFMILPTYSLGWSQFTEEKIVVNLQIKYVMVHDLICSRQQRFCLFNQLQVFIWLQLQYQIFHYNYVLQVVESKALNLAQKFLSKKQKKKEDCISSQKIYTKQIFKFCRVWQGLKMVFSSIHQQFILQFNYIFFTLFSLDIGKKPFFQSNDAYIIFEILPEVKICNRFILSQYTLKTKSWAKQ